MGRLAKALIIGSVLGSCLIGSTQLRAQNPSDFFNMMNSIVREAQKAEADKRRERQMVMRAQRALGQLGFYSGLVDGVYGKATEAALAQYQSSIGRSSYGEFSIADLEQMEVAASAAGSRQSQVSSEIVYNPVGTVDEASGLEESRSSSPVKLEMSENAAWIVAASGADLDQVLKAGNLYAVDFLSTVVVRSSNGRFAILLGWLPKQEARQLRDALKSLQLIPADAFLSSGEKFLGSFWLVDRDNVSNRQSLLQFTQFRPAPQFWSHVVASDPGSFPSLKFTSLVTSEDNRALLVDLREKPSTAATRTRKLPVGAPVRVNRELGGWKEVTSLTGAAGWIDGGSIASMKGGEGDDTEGNEDDTTENRPLESMPAERIRRADARHQAEYLLSDLGLFLKDHPDFPDIATLAEEASRLQIAINSGNSDQVEASVSAIQKVLSKSPDFQAFTKQRDEARGEASLKALAQAVDLAKKNKFFLRRYIAENITSENVPDLSSLLKRYDTALSDPKLDDLSEINEELKGIVATGPLKSEYQRLVSAYSAEPQAQVPAVADSPQLAVTNRTRFLTAGPRQEGMVLFNASGRAPNVVRNLRGDIIFEHDRAVGCSYHPISEASSRYIVAARDLVKERGAKEIIISEQSCLESNFDNYDFIVGLRDELLKIEKDRLILLQGLVETEHFQLLELVSAASPSADTGRFESSDAIESSILDGRRAGFGAIRVKNASAVLCVVASQDFNGHRAIIDANEEVFAKAFNGKPGLLTTDLEQAFIAVKRGQCGGIYAESKDLKGGMEALRRDKLVYAVLPFWADDGDIARAEEELTKAAKVQAEAAADQARKAADQEALEVKKAADEAKTKAAREDAMRRESGARARTSQTALSTQIQAMVSDPANSTGAIFPQTSSWLKALKGDGWEFVGLTEKVADFGVSSWKERKLDTIVVDFSFAFKNRLLGENRAYCRSLGIIIDSEFETVREPVEDECRNSNPAIDEWKLGQRFSSQWVAD